jgi:arginase
MGVEQGPNYIRNNGLIERLQKDEWKIHDVGNIDFSAAPTSSKTVPLPHEPEHSLIVGYANQKIFEQTKKHSAAGDFILTLGGDHSIGIGSISGILTSRPDTAVIWIDAHADINTPNCSSSKNIHGMVLSYLMNLEQARKVNKLYTTNKQIFYTIIFI